MTNGLATSKGISRRLFLLGLAALPLVFFRKRQRVPTFSLDGANATAGHLLREGAYRKLPVVSADQRQQVVIIGGGIAGLAAARRLGQLGISEVTVLELESELGGNASSRANAISAFPLGAHYLPIPTRESAHVRELLTEVGLVVGEDAEGRPLYDDRHLLHAPQSRLYRFGRWQEGILPTIAVSAEDRQQYQRFFAQMEQLSIAFGADGKRAFAIPVAESSADPKFIELDRQTMAEYLTQEGYTSEVLRWYINYCCRDDFGTPIAQLSAWAGVHYFAARVPYCGNDTEADVFTWPEGNGWLVAQIKQRLSATVRTDSMVAGLTKEGGSYLLDVVDTSRLERYRLRAEHVIFAAPRFLYPYISGEQLDYLQSFEYTPWLIGNISIHDAKSVLADMPWDSVSYHSTSLGCVLSTHQQLGTATEDSVLTWYRPLDEAAPTTMRRAYLSKSPDALGKEILDDLYSFYPKLRGHVGHVHLWIWGHAMIRPSPGFIWGADRRAALADNQGVIFANSDMSGMSIFEEAFYQGIRAANRVGERIGI